MTRYGITAIAVLLLACSGCATTKNDKTGSNTDEEIVNRWRIKAVSIADAEAGSEILTASGEWKAFKAKIERGDELWCFRSPGSTWEKRMGWEGYAIFRGKRLVATFTTKEN